MHEVVHHVDGQADRLGPRRHRNADIAGTGAEYGDDVRKIGCQRIASGLLDPRRFSVFQTAHLVIAVGREPANPRAGLRQQAQFRAHEIAGSDEQHDAVLQIEEHGQESHAILASPTSGVDWNYFLYMSRSMVAKRKLFLLRCGATVEF
jgi:hypothetical protein